MEFLKKIIFKLVLTISSGWCLSQLLFFVQTNYHITLYWKWFLKWLQASEVVLPLLKRLLSSSESSGLQFWRLMMQKNRPSLLRKTAKRKDTNLLNNKSTRYQTKKCLIFFRWWNRIGWRPATKRGRKLCSPFQIYSPCITEVI